MLELDQPGVFHLNELSFNISIEKILSSYLCALSGGRK